MHKPSKISVRCPPKPGVIEARERTALDGTDALETRERPVVEIIFGQRRPALKVRKYEDIPTDSHVSSSK